MSWTITVLSCLFSSLFTGLCITIYEVGRINLRLERIDERLDQLDRLKVKLQQIDDRLQHVNNSVA